jgi:hypothetical protein
VALAVALLALAACSSSNKSSKNPTTTTTPSSPTTAANASTGWAPKQVAQAKQLADKLRAAGVACDRYTVLDYKTIYSDYKPTGLPVPGAMAQCTTAGGENLTFETFSGEGPAYGFMGSKIRLVCTSAAKRELPASFPYVASLSWFIEPDTKATGDRIAQVEGGSPSVVSRLVQCPKA